MKLGISLVVYNEPQKRLLDFLKDLENVLEGTEYQIIIYQNSLIDYNLPKDVLLFGDGVNIGFGSGHNYNYHYFLKNNYSHIIISNTDIKFCTNFELLFTYRKNISITCPLILDEKLSQQKMVRSLPNIVDKIKSFVFGGFPFYKIIEKDDEFVVPSFSGCFFAINIENFKTLKENALFDEKYFLYEEDTDLSRRMWNHKSAKLIPKVKIIHSQEKGSKKSIILFNLHLKSLFIYFNKWGYFDHASKESKNYLNRIILSNKN
jgi:GT2 family glycosyltransferase